MTSNPTPTTGIANRFYVRTLTRTDVKKLHGAVGTIEPDLGETARDVDPSFWRWPGSYTMVKNKTVTRPQWKARGRLFSTVRVNGVSIGLTLWEREARDGTRKRDFHPKEFRIGLRGVGVRAAVPANFDTTSLMVVEQAPNGAGYDYVVRLITSGEPDFRTFARYLTENTLEHSYGYGP